MPPLSESRSLTLRLTRPTPWRRGGKPGAYRQQRRVVDFCQSRVCQLFYQRIRDRCHANDGTPGKNCGADDVSVFAYMGFEHVVANSALFAAALLEQPESVNIAQMGENFLFSLVGNYGWRWARDRSLLRLPEDHRRDAPHEDLSCAWHKVQSTVDMRRQKRLAPRAHETRPRLGYAHSAVLCEHAYEIGRDQP
jgi:hypothetical protein